MDCSTPGFPVHYQLLEFTQTHVHWVGDATQPSHPLSSPSPPAFQSFPASGSFPMSQLFASGGQSIGASASASVLPMNITLLSKAPNHLNANRPGQRPSPWQWRNASITPFHLGEGCCNLHSPLDCQIHCSQMVSLKMWPAAMLGSWMCDSHSLSE